MSAFNVDRKAEAGLRALQGEKASGLSREYGVNPFSISVWAESVVRAMPGYSENKHLEKLREPGKGRLIAARDMYYELKDRPAVRSKKRQFVLDSRAAFEKFAKRQGWCPSTWWEEYRVWRAAVRWTMRRK